MKDIFELSKSITSEYERPIEIAEGLEWSLRDTIKQIDYISNSKYLEGGKDEFGMDLPYYNISNYRLNVAIRATDFDTKDITVVSETRDYVRSLLISKKIKEWIKENKFSSTINRIGEKTPKYGWTLVKKLKVDGKLKIDIVRHTNAHVDQSDIYSGCIKELHPAMSRYELLGMTDIWDKDAIYELADTDAKYFNVVEITGNVPANFLDESASKYEYKLAKFFIVEDIDKPVVLYKKELSGVISDYYRIASWAEQDGRLPRGIIEDMFEAQFGTNEAKAMEREAYRLASRVGFLTDSKTMVNNVVTDLPNGFVMQVEQGERFEQVNTMSNAIPLYQNLADAWDMQAEKVTSTFDAVTGETMPSSTPFRSVAIQNQEASSLFIYRRENIGIFYTDLFNDWIIPEVIKDINTKWILSAEFTADELDRIDEAFGLYMANDAVKEKLLKLELEETFNAEDYRAMVEAYKDMAAETNNTRFLEVPENYFKDFKFKIAVITTNEQRNKTATLESLSNILTQVSNTYDPNTGTFTMLENPALASIFAQIIELSGAGISPITLSKIRPSRNNAPQIEQPQAPIQPTTPLPQEINQSALTAEQG